MPGSLAVLHVRWTFGTVVRAPGSCKITPFRRPDIRAALTVEKSGDTLPLHASVTDLLVAGGDALYQ